jgi:uncharacterized protein (TIGR03118 family)
MRRLVSILIGLALIPLIFNTSVFAQANSYAQKNLVTDPLGSGPVKDSSLINPWGICVIPGNPFWIADNGSAGGVTTLYDKTGAMIGGGALGTGSFTVAPPMGSSNPATPTGCVGNTTNGFNVTAGTTTAPSLFIFDTEDGTISGWNGTGSSTILKVDNSKIPTATTGAVYKGLALLTNNTGTFLLATNFRSAKIEAYDTSFNSAAASFPAGAFTDVAPPAVPPAVTTSNGYAPFGIHLVNNQILVTYALQDSNPTLAPNLQNHDPIKMAGTGYVDVFDNTGTFKQRIMDSHMNAPWGVVLPPASFGSFGTNLDLLVANFGDGTINAYTFPAGAFVDQMKDANGAVITNLGLWDLFFDSTGKTGDPATMYFTAGGGNESQGLFAAMTANPAAPPPTPDFNMSVAPTLQTVTAGQTATYTVTVGSLDGFTSAVGLKCAGQQTNATCALSSASVTPPAGGTITSMVTITTSANPYTAASLIRPDAGSRLLALLLSVPALGFLGLLAVGSTRPRRLEGQKWLQRFAGGILLLLVSLSFLTASGCYKKKSASSGTQRSTNTITITATSGSLSHTVTFTLTVQ